MSLLAWALAGLVAGALANLVAESHGFLEDAIVGVVGSVIAGWLHGEWSGTGVTALDPPGLLVALVGGLLFLLLTRGLTRGRTAI